MSCDITLENCISFLSIFLSHISEDVLFYHYLKMFFFTTILSHISHGKKTALAEREQKLYAAGTTAARLKMRHGGARDN